MNKPKAPLFLDIEWRCKSQSNFLPGSDIEWTHFARIVNTSVKKRGDKPPSAVTKCILQALTKDPENKIYDFRIKNS